MKIIDLLNKIANGEEVPNEIKYNGKIYTYTKDFREGIRYNNYEEEMEDKLSLLIYNVRHLNDEVEILEEEKKEIKPLTKRDIEALGYACGEIQKCFTNGWTKSLENKPLEEEKKIPGKINIELNSDDENKVNYYRATNLECELAFKINEIIDYLDYLKSKGDE